MAHPSTPHPIAIADRRRAQLVARHERLTREFALTALHHDLSSVPRGAGGPGEFGAIAMKHRGRWYFIADPKLTDLELEHATSVCALYAADGAAMVWMDIADIKRELERAS